MPENTNQNQVEDMFDDTQSIPKEPPQQEQKQNPLNLPEMNQVQNTQMNQVEPQVQPTVNAMPRQKKKGSSGAVRIIMVVLVLCIILGSGTYGVYWYMMQQDSQEVEQQVDVSLVEEEVEINTNTPVQEVVPNVPTVQEIDADGDGLSDKDEKGTYKTNPEKVDSDNDGLNDYIEVMTYKTDPNIDDTDKDGYKDGEEVMSGHNPKGDGVLTDVSAVKKQE